MTTTMAYWSLRPMLVQSTAYILLQQIQGGYSHPVMMELSDVGTLREVSLKRCVSMLHCVITSLASVQ